MTVLRLLVGAVLRLLATGVLRLLAGSVLKVLGLLSAATLVLLQVAMPLLVGGGGGLRMGALRGVASRIPVPRIAAPRITIPRIRAPRPRVGRCSFSASTAVVLADGRTKPITDVRVGDRVLAADPVSGERGVRNVTHVWRHRDVLVDLETSDGGVVTTTEDHPFWNATDRQWQPAIALDPGDRLLTGSDTPLTVDGLDLTTADADVAYNLTVDDLHTYYVGVGAHTALVHNTCFTSRGVEAEKHVGRQMKSLSIKAEDAWKAYHGDLYKSETSKGPVWVRRLGGRYDKDGVTVFVSRPTDGKVLGIGRVELSPSWKRQEWQPPLSRSDMGGRRPPSGSTRWRPPAPNEHSPN